MYYPVSTCPTPRCPMAKIEFTELLQGASINQLGQLFNLDRRTVADRVKESKPSGTRGGFPVYKISEVAEMLVHGYMTGDQVSEAQKRKTADKEKDYWDAKLKEQKFLENDGDLWRTQKVLEVFASVFKLFRESMVVYLDNLEHESGLPVEAIEKTKTITDGLLVELREKLHVMDTHEDDDFSDLGL